jgi:hypothetical protein
MSISGRVDRRHPSVERFTAEALEEAAPDLAW